jgi:agmatinase
LIFTFEEIELRSNPPEAIFQLARFLRKLFQSDKTPFLLGGEHSITLGGVMAAKEKYKNLSVLQLDAHLDLRDEYLGQKFSQASVMRRVGELGVSVTAVGIRSLDCDLAELIKREKIKNIFFAPKLPTEKILKSLSRDVYLTLDFDFFDPSIMPSVGTPQPGGFLWQETINFLERVCSRKNIIGADFVELTPLPGFIAPDFLAAKLIYKIITFVI